MNVRLAVVALVVAAAGVFACASLAGSGWSGMNHTSGTIAALADGVLHGESPGHDGTDARLDTVYMPLYPAGIALLRRIGLPWLEALRTGSLLSLLLLLLATGWAARRAGGGPVASLVAMALVTCTAPVHVASLSGRADLFAAAATLLALGAWVGERPLRPWTLAAFAAVAVLARVTSLTVPLAILLLSVIRRDGRAAAGFALRLMVAIAVLLLVLLPIHGPQWAASVLHQLVAAPLNTTIVWRGPSELLRYAGSYAELAAIAALALAAFTTRDEGIPAVGPRLRAAAAVSIGIAVATLSNRGSDHNHLVEVIAIGAIAAASFGERLAGDAGRLFAMLVLVTVAASSWRDIGAVRHEAAGYMTRREGILALVRAERGGVLSEDPLLCIASGRRAAFADPASVRALARAGLPGSGDIERDVTRRRWSLIVSLFQVDPNSAWYRDTHLGESLARAIDTHYERFETLDGFALWRPRTVPAPDPGP